MVLQEQKDRQYVYGNVKLHLPVVDKLKKWNAQSNDITYDTRFLQLLLVDIFGTKTLKAITDLDGDKLRFVRGWYLHFFLTVGLTLIN